MTYMDCNEVVLLWRLLFVELCYWFADFARRWGLFVID
jgi:hypothetical protein